MRERLLLSTAFLLLLFACVGSNEVGEVVMAKVGCGGKVGGCSWEQQLQQQQKQQQQQQQSEGLEKEEVEDSNASKRILWATQKRYISYESLKNDVVPCAKRGVPYYNCWAFPRAHNLYSRGCEVITACARDANP